MKTEAQKEAFRALLTAAGLSWTSPRANSAMIEFKDPDSLMSTEDIIEIAVKHEAASRQSWVDTALAPWCKRHGITMNQGLSVFSNDDAYNPEAPHKDLVTFKSLFEWGGQQNNFAEHFRKNPIVEPSAAPTASAEAAIEDKWKAFGFKSSKDQGLIYSNEAILAFERQIVQVNAKANSGWLSHCKNKTDFTFFGNLTDCLAQTNPVKQWYYNGAFDSFEEEVIETWLMTGGDVEAEAESNAPAGENHGG